MAERSKVVCNYVPCCHSDGDTSNIGVAMQRDKSLGAKRGTTSGATASTTLQLELTDQRFDLGSELVDLAT